MILFAKLSLILELLGKSKYTKIKPVLHGFEAYILPKTEIKNSNEVMIITY